MEELTCIAKMIDDVFHDLNAKIANNIGTRTGHEIINIRADMSIIEKFRSINIPVGIIIGNIYEPIRAAIYN